MPVSITGVRDADGHSVTIRVTSVTQDEPLGAGGHEDEDDAFDAVTDGSAPALENHSGPADDGDREKGGCADAVIDRNGAVAVRAER